MNQNVHNPAHYQHGYIETIYAIAQTLGPEGFKAYCMGNWIKYNARAKHKGGQEDLDKANVYLGWAVLGLPPLSRFAENDHTLDAIFKPPKKSK